MQIEAKPSRRSRSGVATHIGLAVLMIFGGTPLLGLPGLFIYTLASPFIDLVYGARALDRLPMYGGLGVSMLINWLWPLALPAAYMAYRRAGERGAQHAPLYYLGVLYSWALVVSFFVYTLIRSNG